SSPAPTSSTSAPLVASNNATARTPIADSDPSGSFTALATSAPTATYDPSPRRLAHERNRVRPADRRRNLSLLRVHRAGRAARARRDLLHGRDRHPARPARDGAAAGVERLLRRAAQHVLPRRRNAAVRSHDDDVRSRSARPHDEAPAHGHEGGGDG